MNNLRKKQFTPQLAFLALTAGVVIYTIVLFFVTGGKNLYGLFYADIIDNFMDLFNPIKFVNGGDPYAFVELGAMYPALCYLICKVTIFFLPESYRTMSPYDMGSHPQGVVLLAIWTLLLVGAIIAYVLYATKGHKVFYKIGVAATILYSAPVIFLWSRMNFLILALVFLILFMICKDSPIRAVREFSYICLAISAAIKIYPAIFGALLLIEKRWKDTFWCAVYGVVVFFLPFWCFDGVTSIKNFVHNLLYGIDTTDYDWTGVGYRIDFKNNLAILKWFIGGDPSITPNWYKKALVLVLLLLAVGFFLFKDYWKKVLCVTMIMILVPSFNYCYSTAFYLIPLVLFMKGEPEGDVKATKVNTIIGYLYAIAFVMLLAPFTGLTEYMSDHWEIESHQPLTNSVFHSNLGQLVIIAIIALDLIVVIVSKLMSYNKSRKQKGRIETA